MNRYISLEMNSFFTIFFIAAYFLLTARKLVSNGLRLMNIVLLLLAFRSQALLYSLQHQTTLTLPVVSCADDLTEIQCGITARNDDATASVDVMVTPHQSNGNQHHQHCVRCAGGEHVAGTELLDCGEANNAPSWSAELMRVLDSRSDGTSSVGVDSFEKFPFDSSSPTVEHRHNGLDAWGSEGAKVADTSELQAATSQDCLTPESTTSHSCRRHSIRNRQKVKSTRSPLGVVHRIPKITTESVTSELNPIECDVEKRSSSLVSVVMSSSSSQLQQQQNPIESSIRQQCLYADIDVVPAVEMCSFQLVGCWPSLSAASCDEPETSLPVVRTFNTVEPTKLVNQPIDKARDQTCDQPRDQTSDQQLIVWCNSVAKTCRSSFTSVYNPTLVDVFNEHVACPLSDDDHSNAALLEPVVKPSIMASSRFKTWSSQLNLLGDSNSELVSKAWSTGFQLSSAERCQRSCSASCSDLPLGMSNNVVVTSDGPRDDELLISLEVDSFCQTGNSTEELQCVEATVCGSVLTDDDNGHSLSPFKASLLTDDDNGNSLSPFNASPMDSMTSLGNMVVGNTAKSETVSNLAPQKEGKIARFVSACML